MDVPTAAAYSLILAACLTIIPEIPRPISFALFAIVFSVIIMWAIRQRAVDIDVVFRPGVLVGAFMIWIVLAIGFLRTPSFDGFLRIGAFVLFSGSAFFVLPAILPREVVYRALATVATGIVLIGLPAAFIGPFGPVGVWQSESIFGVNYRIPLSVFPNPNPFGAITALGGISAAGRIATHHDRNHRRTRFSNNTFSLRKSAILVVICTLGVVFSGSRAALLSFVAGCGIIAIAYWFGREIATLAVGSGCLFILVTLGVSFGVIPVPNRLELDLTGRISLWRATIDAIAEQPVFGWGPGAEADILRKFLPAESQYAGLGSHNSYLRAFFIGGIIGGVAYMLLSVSALRAALSNATQQGATSIGLLVAVFTILIFDALMVFGLHPLSFVGALVIGYVQRDSRLPTSTILLSDYLPR